MLGKFEVSRSPARRSSLRNAEFLGKGGILQIELFSKDDERARRQTFADQLREFGEIPDRASQDSLAAQDLGDYR